MTFLKLLRATALLALGAAFSTPTVADIFAESEPNNPCQAAQEIGMPQAWPSAITGELTLTGSEPPGDVDFFILQGVEGMRLRAGLRGDTDQPLPLGDPFLGLFDRDCHLLALNDDYLGLNSRLDFYVPTGADGYFILAASGCCDPEFVGEHYQQGAYRLRVSVPPEPIESITGRLVDAVSGAPLPGSAPPFSFVELLRCTVDGCFNLVTNAGPDDLGVFRFETDFYGVPIDPGQFLIRAFASEYSTVEVGPFDVGLGETADLGDIGLQPPPFVFENIVPCADIPSTGGKCNYSVDIRNNSNASIQGLGWSLVNASGGTSPVGFTMFPAANTRNEYLASSTAVYLAPSMARKLTFSFRVPSGVAAGTFICADAWFSDRTTDYFGTQRYQTLFCVMKQYGGDYAVVDPNVAASMLGIDNVGFRRPRAQLPKQ